MLAELEAGMPAEEILKRMDDGLPKLWVIFKALHLRREHPDWFGANVCPYSDGRGRLRNRIIWLPICAGKTWR